MKKVIRPHNAAGRLPRRRAAGAAAFLTFFLSGCAAQTGETEVKAPTDAATMQQAQQALPASIPPEQRKKIEESMRNSRSGASAAAPAVR